jgi:hypothetical protein
MKLFTIVWGCFWFVFFATAIYPYKIPAVEADICLFVCYVNLIVVVVYETCKREDTSNEAQSLSS